MSEFSESYHLKSNDLEEAVQLLKKANLKGYVYPARDGWVSFVADTSPQFKFSDKLQELNIGLLLHFVNTPDFGWEFDICVKNEIVCNYCFGFEEETQEFEMIPLCQDIKETGFEKLISENVQFEFLRKYFDKNSKIEDIMDAYHFAESMKIYFFDWVSYHYAEMENGEFVKYGEYDNLKLIKVD